MKRLFPALFLCLLTLAGVNAQAETPEPAAIVASSVEAGGGAEAFAKLGVLQLNIDEQENLLDGSSHSRKSQCFVDAGNLTNLRMELPGNVIVVRNGDSGWAKMGGTLDDRPQSPKMARGTLNQKLIPVLMPFSFTHPEFKALAAVESTFSGTPTWRVAVRFPKDFFTSPSMNTTWNLEISRADNRLLAAEFQPPLAIAKERKEGVRYTTLRTTDMNGVAFPAEVLVDGIDQAGNPTGHTRIVKITSEIRGPFEPALFLHPDRMKALEESMAGP